MKIWVIEYLYLPQWKTTHKQQKLAAKKLQYYTSKLNNSNSYRAKTNQTYNYGKTEMEYSPTTQKYHQQGPPSQPPLEQPQNKGPTRQKWLRLRVPEKHIQKQAKFIMNIQTEFHEPKISKVNKLRTSYINNACELHQPNNCKCCWTLL